VASEPDVHAPTPKLSTSTSTNIARDLWVVMPSSLQRSRATLVSGSGGGCTVVAARQADPDGPLGRRPQSSVLEDRRFVDWTVSPTRHRASGSDRRRLGWRDVPASLPERRYRWSVTSLRRPVSSAKQRPRACRGPSDLHRTKPLGKTMRRASDTSIRGHLTPPRQQSGHLTLTPVGMGI
jgi:hypothetical protein